MSRTVQARLFQGTRDVLPSEALPRQELVDTLTRVFQRFGFAPLETPAMEYVDVLLGKYGSEGEKLIYKLAYKGGDVLALRYDLTVPLSRMVAMNPNLPMPFKRYQIQPVWRGDRPQPAQGRFREFIQCDVDTVGSASMAADAENIVVVHDGILTLGIEEFVIRVNNRKILKGLTRWAGVPEDRQADLFRTIDKLDKIGIEGVTAELQKLELWGAPAQKVLDAMEQKGSPSEVLESARALFGDDAQAAEGLTELKEVLTYVEALGVSLDRIQVDLHLTRGLDYYTGPIYEVNLTSLQNFGSLGGGGRYDDLMTVYGKAAIPATGVSIGLSRVLAALFKLELFEERSSPSRVLVMRFPDTPLEESLRLASELRDAKIPSEVCFEAERLKKQFQLAERKGIPIAAILGAREVSEGTVNLKHLASGEQVTVARADAPAKILEF